VLIDEIDTVFGDKAGPVEGIRALLDSGNRRGTPVPRAIAQGRGYALVEFDVFCPKATAGIGGLPDTVLDRAIVISMERRSRAEPVERLRESRVRVVAAPLRDALSGHIGEMDGFTVLEAELPEDLDDRAQDGWEPLLAIADAASGHWPRTARQAADAIFREADLLLTTRSRWVARGLPGCFCPTWQAAALHPRSARGAHRSRRFSM